MTSEIVYCFKSQGLHTTPPGGYLHTGGPSSVIHPSPEGGDWVELQEEGLHFGCRIEHTCNMGGTGLRNEYRPLGERGQEALSKRSDSPLGKEVGLWGNHLRAAYPKGIHRR